MLKKFLCKKCLNEQVVGFWEVDEKSCEEYWKEGYVNCPFTLPKDSLYSRGIKIDENPPPWCPYKLEHLLVDKW